MKTAKGTTCGEAHEFNGKRGTGIWDAYDWGDGRRRTICAHPVGDYGYCGEPIDVTDLPQVTICCGSHKEA